MTKTANKSGPWTKAEKQYIAENCATKPAEDIAVYLRRNPDSVEKYIKENFTTIFSNSSKPSEYDIKSSPIWADLERQFTKQELNMFLFHWSRIISQFRNDVYPTEEMQVVDTIKLEILMNRCLSQQQQNMSDIKLIEQRLTDERGQEQKDLQQIGNLERQIAILRAAQDVLNKDFQDMLNKKNSLLQTMKATRDARIKHLESNKHNFLSLIRKIVEDRDMRERLGKNMEKMRLATNVEYQRLSEWHIYADGAADQPILTPENVLEE